MNAVEKEILSGIQAGDPKAFGYLVRLYSRPMSIFARSIIPNSELAQEIIQDALLKVWNSRQSLQITSSLQAYLYRIVHNLCIDHIRSRNKKSALHISSYDDDLTMRNEVFTLEDPATFFDQLFSEQSESALQKAIDELPAQCREVFILTRFEQLSYPDISEKLNISLSTVKTQMARAIQKLKETLKDYLKNSLTLL